MSYRLFQKRKDLWVMLHCWQHMKQQFCVITRKQSQSKHKKVKGKQNHEETEEQSQQQKAKKEELECANKQKNNQLMCTKIRNAFENILTKQNDTFQ